MPRLQSCLSLEQTKPKEEMLSGEATDLGCIKKCCELGGLCSHIYINAKTRHQELNGFILPSDCCSV